MGSVRFTCKDDVKLEDVMLFDPKLWIVFGHFLNFADGRDLPVVVTSLMTDRENVQAVSKTHEEGRALDVSTRDWSDEDIEHCIAYMKNVAGHYGAISYSDNERRVIVYHNYMNQGDHFHLQVAR